MSPRCAWSTLHTFERLLEVEEGLDHARMKDDGGTEPWTDDLTPLRLLFDLDYVKSDHDVAVYPRMLNRLREIHARWSTSYSEDDPPHWMRDLQLRSLEQLIEVISTCRSRAVRLRVR
jgi:hypothetical protein